MTNKAPKPPLLPEDIPHLDMRNIDTLRRIMAALRSPDGGCPWDLEQNFKSIAPYTIEEAYEVADAIHRNDMQNLREELGDLLLQPIYHAQMAAEAGAFTLDDVVEDINTKMIRRHPHVFGDAEARAAGVAKGFWESNKAAERKDKPNQRTLDGVPLALPGLTRAVKLQNKAARVGFDWPDVSHVFDKVAEELDELKSAPEPDRQSELGDLLFAVANIARHYGVDPEQAMRDANAKFERRFKFIEQELENIGKNPKSSNLEEMDRLWDQAKASGL
jgi:MazG family protein